MVDKWDEKLFFTKKDKIEFVTHIKDRPGIWDHWDRTGTRQERCDRRNQLWGEIVEMYGGKDLTPEDREDIDDMLKRRWGYYRDHYVKCFKDDSYKYKEDPFYKVFSFLDENILKKIEFKKQKKDEGAVKTPRPPRIKPKSRRKMRLELSKQNYKKVDDREGESPQNGNIRVVEIPIENSQIVSVGENELPIEIDGYQEDSMFNIVMEDSDDDDTDNQSQNKDTAAVKSHETNISVPNKNVPVLPKTQPQSQPITQSEIDECDVFGRLVAFKLRKLDLRTRTRIQYFIHQTLYQAEIGGTEDQVA